MEDPLFGPLKGQCGGIFKVPIVTLSRALLWHNNLPWGDRDWTNMFGISLCRPYAIICCIKNIQQLATWADTGPYKELHDHRASRLIER